jgi:predicted anti-sigma-YlaC factor YlaD
MLPIPTCRDMSELVTDYMEHALPLRSWAGARWHLVLCPACRRYYDQVRRTVRLLSAGKPAPPPAATEAEVMASLRDAGVPPEG